MIQHENVMVNNQETRVYEKTSKWAYLSTRWWHRSAGCNGTDLCHFRWHRCRWWWMEQYIFVCQLLLLKSDLLKVVRSGWVRDNERICDHDGIRLVCADAVLWFPSWGLRIPADSELERAMSFYVYLKVMSVSTVCASALIGCWLTSTPIRMGAESHAGAAR